MELSGNGQVNENCPIKRVLLGEPLTTGYTSCNCNYVCLPDPGVQPIFVKEGAVSSAILIDKGELSLETLLFYSEAKPSTQAAPLKR